MNGFESLGLQPFNDVFALLEGFELLPQGFDLAILLFVKLEFLFDLGDTRGQFFLFGLEVEMNPAQDYYNKNQGKQKNRNLPSNVFFFSCSPKRE